MTNYPILPDVIGIHGRKFAGKGEVAKILIKEFGYTLIKVADPMKDMMRGLLSRSGLSSEVIEDYVEGELKERPLDFLGGETCRHGLQLIGTEWADSYSPGLWINILRNRIDAAIQAGERVVVDDIRKPAEAEVIWSFANSRLIKVSRPQTDIASSLDGHVTEIPLPDSFFDVFVENAGSLHDLKKQTIKTIEETFPLFSVMEGKHLGW